MAEQIALNCDCMEYMRTVPDKYFDLACVDPPYGDASQAVNVEREREREDPAAERKFRNAKGRFGGRNNWADKYDLGNGSGGKFSKYDLGAGVADGRNMGGEIPNRGYL